MKNLIYILGLFMLFSTVSCVTGNDDNDSLRELEEQFARTPRVENLAIDGQEPTRDMQSNWEDFVVTPGQQIIITATYDPGNGASSAEFDFSRSYDHTSYDPDDAMPVEPFTDRIQQVTSPMEFSFTYTVPTVDDEGEPFSSGDHINLTWWSSNNLGGQGFNDINLIYE